MTFLYYRLLAKPELAFIIHRCQCRIKQKVPNLAVIRTYHTRDDDIITVIIMRTVGAVLLTSGLSIIIIVITVLMPPISRKSRSLSVKLMEDTLESVSWRSLIPT